MIQNNLEFDDELPRVSSSLQEKDDWKDVSEELPPILILRSGGRINPRDIHWSFIDGVTPVSINFASLPFQVEPLIINLKRVLIDALERNSPSYAINLFRSFARLASLIAEVTKDPIHEISQWHISNFIGKYSLNDPLGRVGQLSALITRWSKMDYPGVTEDAVKLLSKVKKKGNVKGEAVRTLDPVDGPFTEYELQQLISELNNAYATRQLEEQFYYLVWLAILTGQRVSQYCALKVKDLIRTVDDQGDVGYEILIPKAKQRDEVIRDSFLSRPLTIQFGEKLWSYSQRVISQNPTLKSEAALFPSPVEYRVREQLNPQFNGHWNSPDLSRAFREALADIAPISPRTMEPMNLAIGRFRDTLGTRAAQEGFGELVIAEILGHSDTQNVGAYVAVIPEIANRLDEQIGGDLAPIARAFLGAILIRPEDATRAEDPSSTIIDYRHSKGGVGSCGTKYDCKFRAPLACYTCFNFEAWLDGPHEQLLDHLVQDRERLLTTSGPRVAAINDLTISAIRSVIRECNLIKSGISKSDSDE